MWTNSVNVWVQIKSSNIQLNMKLFCQQDLKNIENNNKNIKIYYLKKS